MTLAADICARMNALASERGPWETIWQRVARLVLPDHSDFYSAGYDTISVAPRSPVNARSRYDDTALRAVDRLSSVMESMTTPNGQKWHGYKKLDPLSSDNSQEEDEWFDLLRDYAFNVRYNPRSGFVSANQRAIRSMTALGTGIVFTEENSKADDIARPMLYRWCPLNECYLAVNAYGDVDTNYRRFSMTARQMVQRFGDKRVSDKVRAAAEDDKRKDTERFSVIHAVEPRQERGGRVNTNRNSEYSSVYVEEATRHLIGESGFYEFPFLIYHWQAVGSVAYSESPVMMAMSDILGLNAIRKTTMEGVEGFFDPALLAVDDRNSGDLDRSPGAMNYGWLSPNGQELVRPLRTMERPDFVQALIESERSNVNNALYVDVLQILAQDSPDRTATEALIRDQEKMQLLGPAAEKIQRAMAMENERMVGIIGRRGAFKPGSPLAPPDSLGGREIGASMTSPMERARMAGEALGMERTIQRQLALAQFDPNAIDVLDTDEIAKFGREADGAPAKIIRSAEELEAIRAQKAQQQQAMQALQMAQMGGEAAKNLVPAMGQAQAMAEGMPAQ